MGTLTDDPAEQADIHFTYTATFRRNTSVSEERICKQTRSLSHEHPSFPRKRKKISPIQNLAKKYLDALSDGLMLNKLARVGGTEEYAVICGGLMDEVCRCGHVSVEKAPRVTINSSVSTGCTERHLYLMYIGTSGTRRHMDVFVFGLVNREHMLMLSRKEVGTVFC
ncbi:hypothetical protein KQX54_019125 [Cotesia glomerata]|uniref:Uncharacterized protein n=1 Tax=Cotesia glomerata TaxID=32391 RepID=A0AAV7I3Z0_COTGL|nr:hypothetical protein KQX54_019125 [Cotesia glomerata]